MLPLLLAFAAVIALFTLGVRWGVVIIGKVLGRVVHERHHNAEYITSTGQVPEAWTRPYFERIDEVQANGELDAGVRERRVARLEAQAKRRSIKGIDDLLRYFSRAPVFADDHSRRVLMEELESAKETWLEYMRKEKK
ncbi:MAG: hypothetical protein OXC31_03460 [Spirochaetaceae bacterium]|nr:hypothetical protein [Spirochaetaceae bacterium]